jgi:hypothetical protein
VEIFGTIVLIILTMIFGLSAFANAYESSESRRFDKSDVKYNDGDNT